MCQPRRALLRQARPMAGAPRPTHDAPEPQSARSPWPPSVEPPTESSSRHHPRLPGRPDFLFDVGEQCSALQHLPPPPLHSSDPMPERRMLPHAEVQLAAGKQVKIARSPQPGRQGVHDPVQHTHMAHDAPGRTRAPSSTTGTKRATRPGRTRSSMAGERNPTTCPGRRSWFPGAVPKLTMPAARVTNDSQPTNGSTRTGGPAMMLCRDG
jgi:hypothetical protein